MLTVTNNWWPLLLWWLLVLFGSQWLYHFAPSIHLLDANCTTKNEDKPRPAAMWCFGKGDSHPTQHCRAYIYRIMTIMYATINHPVWSSSSREHKDIISDTDQHYDRNGRWMFESNNDHCTMNPYFGWMTMLSFCWILIMFRAIFLALFANVVWVQDLNNSISLRFQQLQLSVFNKHWLLCGSMKLYWPLLSNCSEPISTNHHSLVLAVNHQHPSTIGFR